eukprot:TRINITY_DN6889_c0_g2_i1.p1 TRINITY_DN6889_c0_g2~~TRINITY_DN6889_c0_g2_i1.p1  ORF type:complete len:1438 (-),score=611.74 TRINITY_DN6889_c0_g2_i1:257-4549(-)
MASKVVKKNDEAQVRKKRRLAAPTVSEIISDNLTATSLAYWAPLGSDVQQLASKRKPFDAQIIEDIYKKELLRFNLQRVVLLEVSHYLENYLWKYFDPVTATRAHLMSIIFLVNDKFREAVPAWDCFHTKEDLVPKFFARIFALRADPELSVRERTAYIVFLINCFQSLEDTMVRKECLRLVSLPLWHNLNPVRLDKELKANPKLARHWNALLQKEKKQAADGAKSDVERTFLPALIDDFFTLLDKIDPENANLDYVQFCERFIELLLDLISQLPTRRFFHAVLQDMHFVTRCEMSPFAAAPDARLFVQLVEMLKFFSGFEINDFTGLSLSDDEMTQQHSEAIMGLQRIAFKHFMPALKNLALTNSSAISVREGLIKHLSVLADEQLRDLAVHLALLGPLKDGEQCEPRDFIMEILVAAHEKRESQIQQILATSIYPTETLLWDDNIIPTEAWSGGTLALPKLNLQFLTFYDYLLRNYDLFRLESAYEIREDLADAIRRMNARKEPNNDTVFLGWSARALTVKDFNVTYVGKAKVGEDKPSAVNAEVTVSLYNVRGKLRDEWESLRKHDNIFLLTIRAPYFRDEKPADEDQDLNFTDRYGVAYVRGAEIIEVMDEERKVIPEWEFETAPRAGNVRTFKLKLDAAQYQQDLISQDEDVYGTFNLVIRRRAKENNFKAVLETIRDLMSSPFAVPPWLHDIFLGYGDPAAANIIKETENIEFEDTFLSREHLANSYPGRKIRFLSVSGEEASDSTAPLQPPFKITFPKPGDTESPLIAQSYVRPVPGIFHREEPKRNAVPFTPVQISAIQSGLNQGLTMVVGPPGTGKTDVAVQIISNWYHNFPNQRTLIVTHSNMALNQLFEKIMALDIHERHLLRLGRGQEQLETSKDFSKYGRVNYMLQRRLDLLAEVDKLAKGMGVEGDVAYTCETAQHFYEYHVLGRWKEFEAALALDQSCETIEKHFPFTKYFIGLKRAKGEEGDLFPHESLAADRQIADKCMEQLSIVASELAECSPFEMLRSPSERANFLMVKQARIVAMTCTHAALKRADLVAAGFHYDNLLMEEAAQILEIETFIPMLCQEHSAKEGARLKRVVLIGDHNQLPPVVKNMAFQHYARFDQSLFTRFVRLGVPTVDLDAQGRARPSISTLYNWRYKRLNNLPNTEGSTFKLANTGFAYDFQMVDVPDYGGHGEITPNPHFYQNLGEAEYVVAVFQYMRLLGVPANKISIITTYNGQKHLIRDVIETRCASNPLFGRPDKVTTVDRFQGQQNDYILLSLVRTKAVGHLRDIRRLVVAMSRARLGLYVFCRKSLFENCYELTNTFSKLIQRPSKLHVVLGETYQTQRKLDDRANSVEVVDVTHMGAIVGQLYMAVADQMRTAQLYQQIAQQQFVALQEKLKAAAKAKADEAARTTAAQAEAGGEAMANANDAAYDSD